MNKPNKAFWIIAVLALLWNLMGVYQFYLGSFALERIRDSVSVEEFTIMESLPSWYAFVFGIAVFTGVLGCFLLLARKKLAVPLFGISLLTVLVIEFYWLFATDIMEVSGLVAAVDCNRNLDIYVFL